MTVQQVAVTAGRNAPRDREVLQTQGDTTENIQVIALPWWQRVLVRTVRTYLQTLLGNLGNVAIGIGGRRPGPAGICEQRSWRRPSPRSCRRSWRSSRTPSRSWPTSTSQRREIDGVPVLVSIALLALAACTSGTQVAFEGPICSDVPVTFTINDRTERSDFGINASCQRHPDGTVEVVISTGAKSTSAVAEQDRASLESLIGAAFAAGAKAAAP